MKFGRREFFGLVGAGTAALVAPDEPLVRRVYSFVGGWKRDWRFPMTDPRHWGAHMDGVNDDAPALSWMLREMRSIYCPPGRVFLRSPIMMPSGTSLFGMSIEVAPEASAALLPIARDGELLPAIYRRSFDLNGAPLTAKS